MKTYQKKWLASLLSVVLVLSGLFIPQPANSQASELQASVELEMELINPGFEEGVPGEDIPGWEQGGEGGTITVTDEVYRSGNQSLHFYDSSADLQLSAESERFNVNGGMDYRANAFMKVMEQSHSVLFEIWFYDGDGNSLADERVLYRAGDSGEWLGEWFEIEIEATAPAGATTASVWFYSGNESITEAYFDDVAVYQLGADPEEDSDIQSSIANPYFNEFEVPGWLFEDPSGGPYVTNEKAYSGNQSLKFITLANQGNTDVRTTWIPVNEAENYQLRAKVFMEENVSHTLGVYIYTYDADGNELSGTRHGLGSDQFTEGEWTDISIEEAGSEDTAYVMARFYTGGVTSMVGYIDDVEILEVNNETETSVDHDNLGFESPVSLGDWHVTGESVLISSAQSYIGNYSLEMKQLAGHELSMSSNKIGVKEGETYYGSVQHDVQDEAHEGKIRMVFYDQQDNELGSAEESISGTSDESWQLAVVEGTAPNQAVYAVVQLAGGDSEAFHAYVDAVDFSTEHPEGEVGEQYPTEVINAGFEEDVHDDGTIPGWVVTETHPESTIERSANVAHSGDYSLYFHDNDDQAGLRVQGEKIAVESGELYLASAEAYILYQSHRIVLDLEFYDRNDQLLQTETGLFNNLPLEVWTTLPVSGIAPPGSAYARINFYSGGVSLTEVYFDDVRFRMLEQEEPLETNLGEAELIGQPVKVPLAQGGEIKTTVEGNNEVYMISNGDPGVFHALDAETGELLFQQSLENGDETVWAMTFAPNGDLYFASDGTGLLYKYDPIAKEMGTVPGRIPTDTKVWDLISTDDGIIYGGTYPGATVFEYDTNTGEFNSFGRVHPTEQYVRGITATNTHIYAAVGSTKHLFKIDRETGEQEEVVIQTVEYPEHQSGKSGFYSDIWVMEGKLFIQSGASTMLVVEEDTLEVIQKFDVSDQISEPSPYDRDLIYFKNEEELYTYNLFTNEVEELEGLDPLPDTPRVKSLEWIELNEGEHAGRTVLAMTTQYSEYFLYDPVDHQIRYIPLEVEPQAVNIQALEISPDNKLYVGGFQRGLAIMDPETDEILETIGTFRQAEGIGFKDNVAYFGTYTGAQIYRYDPSQPIDFGTSPDNNPGFVFDMADQQDRPFVVTSSDNHVFIGSVPGYGLLGGSLAIYDEHTDHWESHRNVVDQQSIIGLAYKDGLLYGGTSIWGGQGGSPSEAEAKMFIWDVKAGEKIDEFTLDIPDIDQAPKMIGALSFDQNGLLWGAIDGTIFAMDVESKEIVKSKLITPSTYSSSKWRPHYIRWGADGYMYTTLSRELVVIDPETLQHRVFHELGSVHNLAIAADGTVYYADATSELYKMPFTGEVGDVGVKVTGAVEYPDTHELKDLSGFTVTLAQEGEMIAEAETNADGAFSLTLPEGAGTYDLVIDKNSYLMVNSEVKVEEGAEVLDTGTWTMYVGDFNGDGRINIEDIYIMAINYNKEPVGDLRVFDVNGDGKIDDQDVYTIVQHYQQRTE